MWRRVWPCGYHIEVDLEVRDSSFSRRVNSLDKELYSTLSLFTRVYKWVPAYCWGVTLQWTSNVTLQWTSFIETLQWGST